MDTMTRNEIKRRLDTKEPITLVEALPRKYYDEGHLPGAINIPHDEIRDRASTDLPDKNATIVVYCASTECRNSRIAAQMLLSLGYQQVFEYVDGKQDWVDSGFPTETSDT